METEFAVNSRRGVRDFAFNSESVILYEHIGEWVGLACQDATVNRGGLCFAYSSGVTLDSNRLGQGGRGASELVMLPDWSAFSASSGCGRGGEGGGSS